MAPSLGRARERDGSRRRSSPRQLGIGGADDRVTFRFMKAATTTSSFVSLKVRQTPAWLFTRTPASESIAASSPDWNISRVMSQPPTNSPLT